MTSRCKFDEGQKEFFGGPDKKACKFQGEK